MSISNADPLARSNSWSAMLTADSLTRWRVVSYELYCTSRLRLQYFQPQLVADTTQYTLLPDTILCENKIGLTQGTTLALEEVRQPNYHHKPSKTGFF